MSKKFIDYHKQKSHNERMISELLRKVRPDIWVLMDLIDKTDMNPIIVFKFLRQVNNVILGSGWGQVTLVINNRVAKYIRGEDTDKIEAEIVLPRPK